MIDDEAPARPSLAVRLAVNVPVSLVIVFVLAFPVGWLRLVHVQAINMVPTLTPDDRVMVRSLGPAPSRGDVVLYRSPLGDALLVGRIVAAGGDEVALDEKGLRLGGCPATACPAAGAAARAREQASESCSIDAAVQACDEDYADPSCPVLPCEELCAPGACSEAVDADSLTAPEIVGRHCYFTRRAGGLTELLFPSVMVPDEHYFVLNDNRVDERDSRIYGAIPRAAIVGVASFVYYASDETGIRWDRMSRRVS